MSTKKRKPLGSDRRICFWYKGNFTNRNTTRSCIASIDTPDTANTVRFIASRNTTSAVRICIRTSSYSIKGV